MNRSGVQPASYAGLRLDMDSSYSEFAQPDDFGFFVGEDGTPFIKTGDGQGNFVTESVDGVEVLVSASATIWNAEFQIEKSSLNILNKELAILLGHYNVEVSGDKFLYPHRAADNAPTTWSPTVPRSLPRITTMNPVSATIGDIGFTIMLTGTDFTTDSVVLWGDAQLSTELIDETQLSAMVRQIDIGQANQISVKVQDSVFSALTSNALNFTVLNPVPEISSLVPTTITLDSSSFDLMVQGTKFVENAEVLWNGQVRPTTYVNENELRVEISDSDLDRLRTVGVVVVNPEPSLSTSNRMDFEVVMQKPSALEEIDEPQPFDESIYLPMIIR